MTEPFASIAISPHNRLFLEGAGGSITLEERHPKLAKAFQAGSGPGLLYLDIAEDAITEEPTFAYWKDFARLYLHSCSHASLVNPRFEERSRKDRTSSRRSRSFPRGQYLPMKGSEYVNEQSLSFLWSEIGSALHEEILGFPKGVQGYFEKRHSSVNLLRRICFHLAENKKSEETPFAFLATYSANFQRTAIPSTSLSRRRWMNMRI